MKRHSERTAVRAAAWAPASISNLGPGFDCLGMAVNAWGDRVEARVTEGTDVSIDFSPDSVWFGPVDPQKNTAAVAASAVLSRLGKQTGVELIVHKGIRAGTGLGSSASSAVAGAMATAALFGEEANTELVLESALDGEAAASGARHGDNVLPSLLGNTVLAHAHRPVHYRRIAPAFPVHLALVLPDVQILTRSARELLPSHVTLQQAVRHASHLAMLMEALLTGTPALFGEAIMSDELVEPVRATLLPCYSAVKRSALHAGAFGCALSGSGPAMFAVCTDRPHAEAVSHAMMAACTQEGIQSVGIAVEPDTKGARLVPGE